MFREEYDSVCNAAAAKVALLKINPLGYFSGACLHLLQLDLNIVSQI